MSLSDYQQQIDEWTSQHVDGYWSPHEILARITEEVGELARLINHSYGPKQKKSSEDEQEMGEEMADIIWAVASLANSLGINLDQAFDGVLQKVYQRDSKRFQKKAQ